MNFLKHIVIICILFLVGCNVVDKQTKISQLDIDFVEPLKKKDKKKQLISVDSVLCLPNLTETRQALLLYGHL